MAGLLRRKPRGSSRVGRGKTRPQLPLGLRWLAFAATVLSLLKGCGPAADLLVDFDWEGGPPQGSWWLTLGVDGLGRDSPQSQHRVWNSDDGVDFEFEGVPHERNFVFRVEARPCPADCGGQPDESLPREYYGESGSMELHRGMDRTSIRVRMSRRPALQTLVGENRPPEGALGRPSLSATRFRVEGAYGDRVPHRCVDLQFRPVRATHALFSRSTGFEGEHTVRCSLAPGAASENDPRCNLERRAEGVVVFRRWALCEGRNGASCGETDAAGDAACDGQQVESPRAVHLRLENASGLRSDDQSLDVTIDPVPPEAGLLVAPARLIPGAIAELNLTGLEPLAACPSLQLSPAESGSIQWSLGPRSRQPAGAGTNCQYRFQIPTDAPDGAYRAQGTLVDWVGNRGTLLAEPALQVDGRAPILLREATLQRFPPTSEGPGGSGPIVTGERVEVSVELDEAAPTFALTVAGRAAADCQSDSTLRSHTCSFEAESGSGDGERDLVANFADALGNARALRLGTFEFDVDPPRGSASLRRQPAYGPAAQGELTWFSDRDPFTSQPVAGELVVSSDKRTLPPRVLLTSARDSGLPCEEQRGPPEIPESLPNCEEPVGAVTPPCALRATTAQEREGESFRFRVQMAHVELEPGGQYCFHATWTDHRGSREQWLRPRLGYAPVVKNHRVDLSRTWLRRVPWGSEATGGLPEFRLSAALDSGAEEEVSDLVVSSDPCGERRLGSTDGEPFDGELAKIALPRLPDDLIDVYVASVSYTGAVSPFQLVRHGEWVATLGGKVPGSTAENPHEALSWGQAHPMLVPGHSGIEISGAQWGRADGSSAREQASIRWRQLLAGPESEQPAPRRGHAMAYDPRRGVTVLFGGTREGSGAALDDTWEWDGSNWRTAATTGARPEPRSHAQVVYHPGRGTLVLFGGQVGGSGGLGDTWEFDGRAWSELSASGEVENADLRRFGHAMAYDPATDGLVAVGGTVGGFLAGDTWHWNGTRWSRLADRDPDLALTAHALVHDRTAGLLLFGGSHSRSTSQLFGGRDSRSTWQWNGAAWQLLAESPAIPGANAFAHHDPTTGRARVLARASGCGPLPPFPSPSDPPRDVEPGTALAIVAEWDPVEQEWVELYREQSLCSSGPRLLPPDSAVALDVHNEFVLFGSPTLFGSPPPPPEPHSETWQRRAQGWVRVHPAEAPPARQDAELQYLPEADRALLMGGQSATGSPIDETALWAFDGSGWRPLSTESEGPGPQVTHAATPLNGQQALVVAPSATDSEEDERHSATWRLSLAQGGPPVWQRASVVEGSGCTELLSGSLSRSVLLSGGIDRDIHLFESEPNSESPGQFWRWDDTCSGWRAQSEGPPARDSGALAAAGDQVVLFGGNARGALLDETWLWSEDGWQRWEGQGPSARQGHSLTSAPGGALLFGGEETERSNDAWVWSARGWHEVTGLPGAPAPPPRSGHAASYDSQRQRGLVFGGLGAAGVLGDTWSWSAPSSAAQTFIVDLDALAPPERRTASGDGDDDGAVRVVAVGACAIAGGSGPRPGAQLNAWQGGHWEPGASHEATAESPSALAWPPAMSSLNISQALRRKHLAFQVRTNDSSKSVASANLSEPPTLATDYVEVVVRYALGGGGEPHQAPPSPGCEEPN